MENWVLGRETVNQQYYKQLLKTLPEKVRRNGFLRFEESPVETVLSLKRVLAQIGMLVLDHLSFQ